MRRICRRRKADEICRSHETMVQQMKVVGDAGNVNAVSKKPKRGKRRRGRGSRNANSGEIVVNFADVSMT